MGDWELMTAAIIDMGKRTDILGRRVAALLCWYDCPVRLGRSWGLSLSLAALEGFLRTGAGLGAVGVGAVAGTCWEAPSDGLEGRGGSFTRTVVGS